MALLALASPAFAATINVNTTADELNADGDCALREAVRAANLNLAVDACTAGQDTGDTVELDAGTYTLAIPGGNEDAAETGDLDLSLPPGGPVTVAGAGARATTVDGADLDRVFDVRPTGRAEISGHTITNGSAPPAGEGGGPGGEGGGVLSFLSSLTLRRVAVTDSTASPGRLGGGVFTGFGALEVFDSVISGNRVPNGPILFRFGGGGGLAVNRGPAALTNTTVSGNTAAGLSGGGILAFESGFPADVTLTNATVNDNGAASGANLEHASGAKLVTRNSIVANPASGGSNCASPPPFPGTITSGGGNLEFPGTSCGFTAAGDKQNENPLLGALADNSGPTNTHALHPGSPAIDAADNTACPARDQRGVQRPTDGDGNGSRVCDMGALEREGRGPSPSPPGPECTIRGTAGNDVIRGTPGRDVICTGAGNDVVYGPGGNDTIRGGSGNDVVRGGEGNDRLAGGPGRDTLYGNGGADSLNTQDAGRGNDVARGGAGADACATDPRDVRSS